MTPSILHVIAPGPVGGAESAVLALTTGLRDRGEQVAVLALADPSSTPFIERLRNSGIPVDVIDSPGRNYLRDVRGIRHVIRTRQANVLHTHGYRADIVGAWAARGLGVASLATAHGFTWGGWKNRLNQRVQIMALKRHGAVVAVSRQLGADLVRRGLPQERLVTLRNAWRPPPTPLLEPLAARAALGLPPNGPVVGWVGRLAWVKAADAALEAFALTARRDAILSFIGDGPDRPALEAVAARLGLDGRVRFHGLVNDAWRTLRAFDVLLLSSRSEGTPMILLEAMHAGVPIVSTAVGGIPDLLDEKSAKLVPWGDAQGLGAAIADVLRDPDSAHSRATAARSRLDTDFAADQWVSRHVELYHRLLGRKT